MPEKKGDSFLNLGALGALRIEEVIIGSEGVIRGKAPRLGEHAPEIPARRINCWSLPRPPFGLHSAGYLAPPGSPLRSASLRIPHWRLRL